MKENLRMGGYVLKDRKKVDARIDEVVEMFPILKERSLQYAKILSGGEQQMLAIGRGLMGRPKLLMLDEPSLGLAPIVVGTMFQVIKELHGEGLPILLVEQNAQIALSICNRGYVLQSGEIVLSGTGEELLADETVREAYLGES